jgi:hypothetical protein
MPTEPTLAEVISLAIESRLLDLHTCMPGKVAVFDPTAQSASVQPMVKRAVPKADGDGDGDVAHEVLPIIHNVPIAFPGGGGYSMRFPVLPGDHVWLMFSEAAMATWRTTGQISEPGDLRRHDLSYACAIYLPFATTVEAAVAAADPLLPPTGAKMVCPSPFTFGSQVTADFVALAAKVDFCMDLLKTHVHPTAMGPSSVSAELAALVPVGATKLKAE